MSTTNTYKSLISQSETDKKEQDIDFAVEEAKQQTAADILATKKEIASAKRKVNEAKGAVPFSAKAVLEAQVELKAYEEGLVLLEALNVELFGEAK